MRSCKVVFSPLDKTIEVEPGTGLLEAAGRAGIIINSVCGGDGICGRCKMVVREGRVGGETTALLTREEIREGIVLACQTSVESDLLVEIPEETRAVEKIAVDEDAQRFRAIRPGITPKRFRAAPLVDRVFLQFEEPTLSDNLADFQRLQRAIERQMGTSSTQMGLKVLRRLPEILRDGDYAVTATIGKRRNTSEIMEIEPGDRSDRNFMAVIDVGTSTVVAHLVDVRRAATLDAQACFNSQFVYGREVTARMMVAEKKGYDKLREVLVGDINALIVALARRNDVDLRDVTAVVCSGNTTMTHLLLGLPTANIRREPFIAVSTELSPFRAAEVGIKINPRGLLYTIPGIGSWVGGDLTAGILATGLHERDDVCLLLDVGTNGEIIIGNREWLMACSASTGPALEGAGVECGMIAEKGAIERVYIEDGEIRYKVIGNVAPTGICGSGIIDLVAVLVSAGIIDRSGEFIAGSHPRLGTCNGSGEFALADDVVITQDDISSVITAKAAVFAATKSMIDRLSLSFADVKRVFLAGGFGSYINRRNAVGIGLLPDMPVAAIQYVGNTSIWGATLAALSTEAYATLCEIRRKTTYFDLMGTPDYVEQFKQAMFLPHTDIELFPSVLAEQESEE